MAKIGDQEAYENSYHYFVEALSVLAASPEQACEMLGHFNVAFEAKIDAETGPYLFDYESCPFSLSAKDEILQLMKPLQNIPDEVLSFTKDPGESLEKMRHPCWAPVRQQAASVLNALASYTEQNKRHFNF